MKLSMYLAGKIKKNHENPNETHWDEVSIYKIKSALEPEIEVTLLDPAKRTDDLSLQKSVFGRDMLQVFSADIVMVDARDRRGLGVGAEMMWAKINSIPVLTWSPKDSHYNKTKTSLLDVKVNNWVHPFVENLSDIIVNDLQEVGLWIKNWLDGKEKIKDISFMHEAMQFYKDQELLKDRPMLDALEKSGEIVKDRVQHLKR